MGVVVTWMPAGEDVVIVVAVGVVTVVVVVVISPGPGTNDAVVVVITTGVDLGELQPVVPEIIGSSSSFGYGKTLSAAPAIPSVEKMGAINVRIEKKFE